MKPPVLTKADMYARRDAGEFGNTLRRFTDVDEWLASNDFQKYELWGVQHTRLVGFPGTRLNVPRTEAVQLIREVFGGRDYCLSCMVTAIPGVATLWEGDVMRSPDGPGIECWGNARPAPGSWRTHMKTPRVWRGSAVRVLLDTVLNDNSRDDLEALLDEYPDHVIELSALDTEVGTVRGRNAVVWEVRRY